MNARFANKKIPADFAEALAKAQVMVTVLPKGKKTKKEDIKPKKSRFAA